MKLLPSVFSSLYSRINIFVFALNSKRHFYFCVTYLRITRKDQKIRGNLCRLPSAVNVIHALKLSVVILKHLYFITKPYQFMTLLLALQSHYLTGRPRLKSSSKCLLIDLDTPLSLRQGLVRLQNQIFGFKKAQKHPCTCLGRLFY